MFSVNDGCAIDGINQNIYQLLLVVLYYRLHYKNKFISLLPVVLSITLQKNRSSVTVGCVIDDITQKSVISYCRLCYR